MNTNHEVIKATFQMNKTETKIFRTNTLLQKIKNITVIKYHQLRLPKTSYIDKKTALRVNIFFGIIVAFNLKRNMFGALCVSAHPPHPVFIKII